MLVIVIRHAVSNGNPASTNNTTNCDTDLARNFSTCAVHIEKDLGDDIEEFRDIVPLAAVVLQEPFVQLVERGHAQRDADPIVFHCDLCHFCHTFVSLHRPRGGAKSVRSERVAARPNNDWGRGY